jgi:hypothetical protein
MNGLATEEADKGDGATCAYQNYDYKGHEEPRRVTQSRLTVRMSFVDAKLDDTAAYQAEEHR